MARGRHSYPKVKVVCVQCGWSGVRSTFMAFKPCPKCIARRGIRMVQKRVEK